MSHLVSLADQEHIAPKSALRHRPIAPQTPLADAPRVLRASRTQRISHPSPMTKRTRSSRPMPAEQLDEVPTWQRTHEPLSKGHAGRLVASVTFGMVLAVCLLLLGQFVLGWLNMLWNNMQYGYPRTYQANAVVGHHDSTEHPSHFIALNLDGQIEVIEFPGGDVSQAKIYLGPRLSGPHADLVPVTLLFVDTRHNHLLDMLIQVQGETFVFHNANGQFHPPSAGGAGASRQTLPRTIAMRLYRRSLSR